MSRSRNKPVDKKEECRKLFNSLPENIPIRIHFKHPNHYEPKDVIISSKQRHGEYSYSFFGASLNRKFGCYFWIEPDYIGDYFSRRVVSFEILKEAGLDE